ncbi:hypothetical protein F4561_006302 [Lipingzhangella halophila]|uniref:Secreted protein n=1 Tax=Lipingzhangella halophila TaxID=1783352 RepID=A0A7W7RPT0_9ACTN|nr:DUF6049 family protein [Lipingzhangella halophila]MBB4935408.1 hypothetical protein [Lipingzhangella halophila]
MRRLAHLTAVVAAAAALAPALPASSAAALAAERAALPNESSRSDEDPPVIVDEITPRAVEEDSTVTITGQVNNTTDETVEEVTARLRYSPSPLGDRSELDAHAEGDTAQPPKVGPTVDLDEPLDPGATAKFELETDAEDLDLERFGVYPIAVDAVTGSGDDLGIQYTFLPYQGEGSGSDPVDIAWLWPLMDQPQRADDDTYLGEGLTNDLAPEGRLNELLAVGAQDGEVALDPPDPTATTPEDAAVAEEEAGDTQQSGEGGNDDSDAAGNAGDRVPITWTVDPGLLSDINRLTAEPYHVLEDPLAVSAESQPTAKTYDPSPEAASWIAQAREIIGDDSLISTPFASADIAALLRNGLENDAEAAMSLGDETVERVLERRADSAYAVPANGTMNQNTRDFFAEHGAERFILRDAAMPGQDWLGYTPTAQANFATEDDGSEGGSALVADSQLTSVLGTPSQGPGETALAQQRFAAETALISAEQTDTDRTILAAPPRDWDPGAEFAQDVLRSSEDLPWLNPVALDDVDEAGSESEDERRGLTYPEDESDKELNDSYLGKVKEVRREARLFNTVLEEGRDPFRPAILRMESASWRDEKALGNQARSLLDQAVTDSRGKIRIIEPEPVTLASKSGTIGVLVANDLEDETVTVHLSMFSTNSERLGIGEYQDTMEIGPGGKTTVYVPLNARVNGRTVLHLNLHNADGEPVSTEEAQIPVNATGMGTQALLISAGGALVLVVALAPRAMRKWVRSRSRAAPATSTEAGPDPAPENQAEAPQTMPHNDKSPSGERAHDTDAESSELSADADATAGADGTESGATGEVGEDENRDQ